VKRTVCEQVPYTVCRKVPYQVVEQVPVTTQRNARGAYVDASGTGYESEGPGRCFKEGASANKQVPYTVKRNVTEVVKKQCPYTVVRCVLGAYVDDKGVGHECEAPGRNFREGAMINRDVAVNTTRMVRENVVKQVPYTVCKTINEECVKKVPYTVCRMVPTTVPVTTTRMVPQEVIRQVPVTTQRMARGAFVDASGTGYPCEGPGRNFKEGATYNKMVPSTVCKMVPVTTTVRVPYQVTEMVPCTVCKRVKVCVPEEVCVKKCRMVPVTVCENKPVCCQPTCCPTTCCDSCCDTCHEGFLSKLRSRLGCHKNDCCDSCCDSCGSASAGPKAEPIEAPKAVEPPAAK
jgi:hypothetical protein